MVAFVWGMLMSPVDHISSPPSMSKEGLFSLFSALPIAGELGVDDSLLLALFAIANSSGWCTANGVKSRSYVFGTDPLSAH